jgi:hypothetical protein
MAMNFFEFSDPNEGVQGVIKLGHNPSPVPEPPSKLPSDASKPNPGSRLDFLKSFCEVDTFTVLSRLKKVIWPFNRQKFFEDKSDLYGAMWIPTTLVFILSVAGTLASKLSKNDGYSFDPGAIVTTASVIYIFLFSVPAILGFFLLEGTSIGFYDALSLYGYSYFSFLPAAVISVARYEVLRWISFGSASLWAEVLIFKNFYSEIQFLDDWRKYAAMGTSLSGYLALTLVANLYLFN